MPYIGTDINYGDIAKQVVTSPGGGSTTPTGSLTYAVPKSESIMVTLDGVTQVPGVDYNVTLSTVLTFTTLVPAGVVVLVYFLGRSLDLNTPAADTVGIAQLSATGSASSSTFLRGDNAWVAVDALPSQSGNAGKFLTTNASTASWATISTVFPFFKADGSADNITITNGEFPFYQADGSADNIGVS